MFSRFIRQRTVASVVLTALLSSSIAVTMAQPAEALTLRGAFVDDCGKGAKAICTRYWNQEMTQSFYDTTQTFGWKAMANLPIPAEIKFLMGYDQKNIDDYVTALEKAVRHEGCLQLRWRKDKKGGQKWGATTHPNYCWEG